MPTEDPYIKASCNICRTDNFTVIYAKGVAQVNQIVKCDGCGLMYANPRRDADCVFIQSYPEDPNYDCTNENPQRFEKECLQVRDFDSRRQLLNRLHPNRGKLVEVGSSMGFLLDSLRKDGWDVLGIEPDRATNRYAVRNFGINTINSTLESAKLSDNFAEAVIMLHVIEHVPDPVGTLKEIRRILKPGGHLFLETPRYDTLMFRLLGHRERSLSCDGHIFFFTTETLRKAYISAGLEFEHLEFTGRTLTLDRLVYNLGVISKSQTLQRGIELISRRAQLNRFSVRINIRDIQAVCLAKPFFDHH